LSEPQADFASRRDRFRQYESTEAVENYLQRLEREWPTRAELAQQIAEQVATLNVPEPVLLELCCGPGRLAQTLLDAHPTLRYTGVDLSPPFLAFAQTKLAPHAERVTLIEADLSQPNWPIPRVAGEQTGHFHAIVSMQSLHDVGDEATIKAIYGLAKTLLRPGGFFLNADLVVATDEALPQNPGRLSIDRHIALLGAQGYHNPRCLLAHGGFGALIGWNR